MVFFSKLSILEGAVVKPRRSRPLHKLFEECSTCVSSDHVAIVFEKRRITFHELDIASNRMARTLVDVVKASKGKPCPDVEPLVAVCMLPSDRLISVLLACWKSGAAYLPIDPAFPPARVTHILQDSRPFIVIKDAGIELDSVLPCGKEVRVSTYEDLSTTSIAKSQCPLTESDKTADESMERTAIVLYTSGSTGTPKGVKIPHRAVLNRLEWQWRVFPFSDDETIATCLKTALTFVDSVSEIFSPLLKGKGVVVAPKATTRNPEDLLNLLAENDVRRLVLVPSLLRAILLCVKASGFKAPVAVQARNIKLWICSGEVFPFQLLKDFFEVFPQGSTICNFYGSTEVMGDVTYQAFESPEQVAQYEKAVPIGIPLDNVNVYLLDEQLRPVPVGQIGEIFISGFNVATGYLGSRECNRFCPNPFSTEPGYTILYKTGDFGRITEAGCISYEGRLDSQVKVRGHRVDLTEVEGALTEISGINRAVVICAEIGKVDQTILAFVTVDVGVTLNAKDIKILIKNILPSYMMPEVVVLDNIPLLPNGKTDRQSLLKEYNESRKSRNIAADHQPDLSEVPESKRSVAALLYKTIEDVLAGCDDEVDSHQHGRQHHCGPPLGLQINFYEIGGNSLNSLYTVMKLREKGFNIGIGEFVASKNLGEILDKMCPKEKISSLSNIVNGDGILSEGVVLHKNHSGYIREMLGTVHKEDVYRIISSSFFHKADLDQWLMPGISIDDYIDVLDKLWDPLIIAGYSFVIKSVDDGSIIGTTLCFDVHDEPQIVVSSKLAVVFQFLEHIESPLRNSMLPQGKGRVLYSFMMGTADSLPYQKNIEIIHKMEEVVLQLAKEKDFEGVFSTNTSPLTQQISLHVNGYQMLLDYQANLYVAPDGSRPFEKAPSSQRVICSWKPLKNSRKF